MIITRRDYDQGCIHIADQNWSWGQYQQPQPEWPMDEELSFDEEPFEAPEEER